MTGRIGTGLGTGLLAAVLAASVGAASAQDSGGGARHFERFTTHELLVCEAASGLMQDLNSGDIKAHYLENFYAFRERTRGIGDPIEVFTDRVYLLFHNLSREELGSLADACERTLEQDEAPARFVMIRPETIGEAAFATFTATRAADRAAAERGRLAFEQEERERQRADAARLDSECRAIVDAGVEKATRNFRQAQGEVQVWIRAGSFGSPPGQYDIQNGCSAIDSAGSQLNAKQCPAEYANALMKFRAGYFIDFNGSGGFSCN
ncbi:hypothetical protein [Erythrobacter colymbi]|uniref:hypothetical protein n=1 Tax=Erythrobacter colymbi TaxID=1161202 RepID=UPI00117F9E33|nr:hypothetical protein [Erythrobacter colymbi]